jgi:hypothetical protein
MHMLWELLGKEHSSLLAQVISLVVEHISLKMGFQLDAKPVLVLVVWRAVTPHLVFSESSLLD